MYKDWKLEVINDQYKLGQFKFVLFDFDGTISLIREGWQKVMKNFFAEELQKTPKGRSEPEQAMRACVDDFVDLNTGRQTIYQCFSLVEEIERREGKAHDAQFYKDEYHRRLLEQIQHRIDGLENGIIQNKSYVVPGSFELLENLKSRGMTLFLASGTDEEYAAHEADILGVSKYFDGNIYGAQRDYKTFSKKMIVQRIMDENNLAGEQLLGFGDGYVEIENVKEHGGYAVGVASNEKEKNGNVDEWKRNRLIRAKADIIIPDYQETDALMKFLFKE